MLRLPLIFSCAVGALFVASTPRSVRADERKQTAPRSPHRIGGGVGVFGATTGLDVDGHWQDGGTPLALGVAYGYAMEGLELEGGVTYLDFIGATRSSDLHARILLPYVGVRFYFGSEHTQFGKRPDVGVLESPKPDSYEVGFSFRGGGCFMFVPNIEDAGNLDQTRTHKYLGWHATLVRPDVRFWVSHDFALELAAEFTIAMAHDIGSVKGYYLSERGGLVGLGIWVGGVFAP